MQRYSHNMQSPETSITLPSLAHQQSVDSGSGTDEFSLINANPELSEASYLDLEATCRMPPSLGNHQSSSENLPPVRPAVVDWVQKQSLHDQPSDAVIGLQRPHVDSVPLQTGQAKQSCAGIDEHFSRQEGRQQPKRVYDITTLLKLRETQRTVPVMLRVKPEAISGVSITAIPQASI